MKKLFIPLMAILALTVTANAQGKMGKKAQHQQHEKGMMAKQLNFSEVQKKQAKAINDDCRKKLQELNKNEALTVKVMRDKKETLIEEKRLKMDALLTAEQKTKKAQLLVAQKAKAEIQFTNQLAKMKTNVGLSDEQVASIRSQRASTRAKMEKIKNNESLSRVERRAQMMALKTDAKDQRNNIFTPDQIKKMEDMKKTRMNKNRIK